MDKKVILLKSLTSPDPQTIASRSIAYLKRILETLGYDIAASSAEVGTIFMTAVLIHGSAVGPPGLGRVLELETRA